MSHKTVLKEETLTALALKPGATVFEGTGGEGGLSTALVERLGPTGTLVITDLDALLLGQVAKNLQGLKCNVHLVNDNFRNIKRILVDLVVTALDAIIVDLGLCSYQIEESGRGFSFTRHEPLVMTFSSIGGLGTITAADVVNNWSQDNLADVIYGFGGEPYSRKIAKAIVDNRPFVNSKQLADVIASVTPRSGRLHPATKTFQAIRMATNDEIGALKQLLTDGWQVLIPEGRLAVISFHEIEDRAVKRFFTAKVNEGEAHLVNKKPITPDLAELRSNPRARSAKLRVIKKLR